MNKVNHACFLMGIVTMSLMLFIACPSDTANTTTTTTLPNQVVTNYDFNTDINNWTAVSGDVDLSHDAGGQSGSGLLIDMLSNPSNSGFSSDDNILDPGSRTKLSFYLKGWFASKSSGPSHVVVKLGDDTYYNILGDITNDNVSFNPEASITATDTSFNTFTNYQKVTLNGLDQVTNLTSNDFEVIFTDTVEGYQDLYIDELAFEE